jgi:hypothetical protein
MMQVLAPHDHYYMVRGSNMQDSEHELQARETIGEGGTGNTELSLECHSS